MTAVVIVGAQWGDEGKGKIVDLYAEAADVVVRFAGGPNAGHTLVVGDQKLVLRLVPSGILHARTRCLMGQGMVVDPAVLLGEIDALEARNVDVAGRLFLSDRAHLILPYHPLVDGLREAALGEASKIGTTKRGIGPCYEDKAARRGVRVGDLHDLAAMEKLVERAALGWAPLIESLGGKPPSVREIVAELTRLAPRLLPLVADTSVLLDESLRAGRRILLEGAQGTMLDLDHGTYPFVTSSSAVAGGACVGAGIGPTRIRRVIGITKAYATRVGQGPFPTELFDATGDRLRNVGVEFGSVTGRPRRTGWLDVPALRYAARVNGLDRLAVTKLDVLTGLPEVRVCVGYEKAASPSSYELEQARPIYETLAGWTESLTGARSLEELPGAARDYVRFVAEATGVAVSVVSVGPRRDETITLEGPFA